MKVFKWLIGICIFGLIASWLCIIKLPTLPQLTLWINNAAYVNYDVFNNPDIEQLSAMNNSLDRQVSKKISYQEKQSNVWVETSSESFVFSKKGKGSKTVYYIPEGDKNIYYYVLDSKYYRYDKENDDKQEVTAEYYVETMRSCLYNYDIFTNEFNIIGSRVLLSDDHITKRKRQFLFLDTVGADETCIYELKVFANKIYSIVVTDYSGGSTRIVTNFSINYNFSLEFSL